MTALREIERSHPAFTAMCAALQAADLPTADLLESGARYFALGTYGYGGLVELGNRALLRSMVVAKDHRGRGVGAAILNGLLAEARELGLEEVWLLTTTADEFFSKRGFSRIPRGDAHAAIAGTAQFKQLCPGSAVLMRRSLLRE